MDINKEIIKNMGLVKIIANQYTNRGLEYEDLVQCGTIGLYRGLEKYNPELGYKLSTYVHFWIRAEITENITKNKQFKMSRSDKSTNFCFVNFDDFIEVFKNMSEESDNDEELYTEILKKIEDLSPIKKYVIKNVFFNDKTLDFLGKELNLSRERIRQIKNEAIKDLKRSFKIP